MSGVARPAAGRRARSAPPAATDPARLHSVPAQDRPGKASSGTFVLLLAVLLGLGLLGLLGLNMALAQGSFASATLTARHSTLKDAEQRLEQQVAQLDSPQRLALAARALGMVGTTNPVFIDPLTGKILGVPQVASRPRPAVPAGPTTTAGTSPRPSPTSSAAKPGPTGTPTPSASAKPSAPSSTTRPSAPSTHPSPHPTGTAR